MQHGPVVGDDREATARGKCLQPRKLCGAENVVGQQYVFDAACNHYLRLADFLAGNTNRAELNLPVGEVGQLVGLDVGTGGKAVGIAIGLEAADVGLDTG